MRKLITTFSTIAIALLIYPLSLSSQNSFSMSLDANGVSGDQGVTSRNASPDQVVSIQIFGTNIQSVRSLSARFEYDERLVVYEGFDAGNVLPAATGGQAPLTYSLTPTVPGLTFTASTRMLAGTPTINE